MQLATLLILECFPTPLQLPSCWILAGSPLIFNGQVAGYWQEVEHAVVHVDPEHTKHAQLVTYLVSMQTMKELGYFQLPGIVYRSLRHGAVHYHAET